MLRCKLFNARSLRNKLDNLSCLLQSAAFDLIFTTESWLRNDLPDSIVLSKTAYTLLRKDRPDGYGGVAVFLSNVLKFVVIDLPPTYSSLECVAFDVVFSKSCYYRFICIYHPPTCAASIVETANLCSLIDFLSTTTYPLFIVGDFNLPNINWYVPMSLGSLSHDLFLNCMMRNGFTQMVSHPTLGSNCIDLVLVSSLDLIWDISVVEPFSSSCDHSAINFSVSYPIGHSDRRNHCFLDFFNADYCSMISIIKDIDWSFLCQNSLSVEEFWSSITNVLHSCISEFVPRRKQSRKPFSYPMHIRRLLVLKKLWFSKDRVCYKHFARKYDMAVKDFILSQELKVLKKNSLSSFYSYVNSKLTTTQFIPPLVDSNNNLAVSDLDKCAVLNDYFASVFTVDDGLLPVFAPRLIESTSLDSVLFSFDKVLKALKSLPSKCSKTPDGFPSIFLKSLAPAIAFPLSLLFEMSMRTGQIPLVWKTAFVCPVFKKGSRKQPSNYRPISQTCISCKIMESIILSSMSSFLRTHNLISKDQFGFLARRSVCTQLLTSLNNWTLNVDNSMKVDVVYTDIAKAFDSVSHSKLLLKAEAYGFKSNLLQWIRAFLQDRTQCVYIGLDVSSPKSITSGVPQGSVLGPLLFLLYVNDLPDHVQVPAGIKIFADDTKLYLSYSGNLNEPLVQSLNKFCIWSQTWQLSVSYTKCSVISFGSHRNDPISPYSLSGIPLQLVSSVRDLGVCLNSDFTPSMHCSNIAAMAFNRSCILLKSFRSNDVSLLVRLYMVYVRPILESNTPVWNPWFHKDIQCVERVQRFFTRAIFKRAGLPHLDYGDRLANLGLQSLEYRRVFFDLVMCYKIYNNQVDLPFESFFTKPYRTYPIRGHSCILRSKHLPHHAFRAHFFTERVISVWNHLPNDVVTSQNITVFRTRLRSVDLSPFCMLYPFPCLGSL